MKINQKRFLLLLFLTFIITCNKTFSQCGCENGAAVGSLTPVSGGDTVGVLQKGYLRVSSFYKFGSGNQYYNGDIKVTDGAVKSYESQYIGIAAAYGLSNMLTIETETGYFPRKMQDFGNGRFVGSGFSHIGLSAKYNFYQNEAQEFEFTAGIGGKAPLSYEKSNLPQHILPSTGAFGLILHAFLHKGFKVQNLHLFLINRSEFNTENRNDYLYGNSYITSFHVSKKIFEPLTGMLELRNEFRQKDRVNGKINCNSGGTSFVISPHLNYSIGDWNISALVDYPFYKYYFGEQLSNKMSFAFNVSWKGKVL